MGHEASGTVVKVGRNVKHLKVGKYILSLWLRLKSVRNRCVMEDFGGVFVLSLFVVTTSDLFLFLLWPRCVMFVK